MRVSLYRALYVLAPLLGFSAIAIAETRPAVVELFTSEGCSSCPPAEQYIGELVERADVLALTFHVQYWDDLGWHDRFGLPQAEQRQRRYARALHLTSVFTPQAVIDGRNSFVGSDRHSIGHDLAVPRQGPRVALTIHLNELVINLGASNPMEANDVLLVAYRRAAVTPIGRGENSGRTIDEANVVRSLRTIGRWDGREAEYRARIDSLPEDATDVAVLIQREGQSSIVGAASLALHTADRVARSTGSH